MWPAGSSPAAIAVALFTAGVIVNPSISPSELLTLSTPLRFLTYATTPCGASPSCSGARFARRTRRHGSVATSSQSSQSLRPRTRRRRSQAKLERLLARQGSPITFGWAVFPQEGENARSLYRAADERLYARQPVRGDRAARSLYPVGA